MPARLQPRRHRRLFIAKWRESRSLTQAELAERLKTTGVTVSRWERGEVLLNTGVMSALADALGIEPEDLYHDPAKPTPNALLRDQPDEVVDQAIRLIQAILRN
jgi:transcriptional regulator with XRE-family HTH domain